MRSHCVGLALCRFGWPRLYIEDNSPTDEKNNDLLSPTLNNGAGAFGPRENGESCVGNLASVPSDRRRQTTTKNRRRRRRRRRRGVRRAVLLHSSGARKVSPRVIGRARRRDDCRLHSLHPGRSKHQEDFSSRSSLSVELTRWDAHVEMEQQHDNRSDGFWTGAREEPPVGIANSGTRGCIGALLEPARQSGPPTLPWDRGRWPWRRNISWAPAVIDNSGVAHDAGFIIRIVTTSITIEISLLRDGRCSSSATRLPPELVRRIARR